MTKNKRVCYLCGVEYELNDDNFHRTNAGNFAQQCKQCKYKNAANNKRKRLANQLRLCPSCGEMKKRDQFPTMQGNTSCLQCNPNPVKKEKKYVYKPHVELSDDELEERYQRLLKKDRPKGLESMNINIPESGEVTILRNKKKIVRGKIIGKTRDFIIIENNNKVKECFTFNDLKLGEYYIQA